MSRAVAVRSEVVATRASNVVPFSRDGSSRPTVRYGEAQPTLAANGYHAFPIKPGTKDGHVVASWRGYMERDPKRYSDHSVCIQLGIGGVYAFDMDVYDDEASRECLRLARRFFRGRGAELLRVGQSPKALFVYRDADGIDSHRKHVGRSFIRDGNDAKPSRIEVLGDGQYVVLFGQHPETGKEYKWAKLAEDEEARTPLNVPVDQLAPCPRKDVVALADECERLMATVGMSNPISLAGVTERMPLLPSAGNINADLITLSDKHCDDVERFSSAFMHCAVTTHGFAGGYDEWYRPGMMLRAASANWPAGVALALWLRACALYEKYDETEARGKWTQLTPRPDSSGLGAGSLFRLAREHGWQNLSLKGLTVNGNGGVHGTLYNAAILVADWCEQGSVSLWHDVFDERDQMTDSAGKVQEVNESLALQVAHDVTKDAKHSQIKLKLVQDAITHQCRRALYDPAVSWLDGLPAWDGVARLDRLLVDGFGAKDDEYTRAVGANFVIAMVARQYRPGCKVDTMLVLEGKQGVGKSTGLRTLVGAEFFSDSLPDMGDKDFIKQLRGRLLFEISELASMTGTEVGKIKAVLSRQEDRYRDSYGRRDGTHPRRCCFAGTTNEGAGSAYLRDTTGNRRFWPVEVGQVSLSWLGDNREQVWAEAVVRFRRGETWHEVPAEAAAAAQEARQTHDPWEAVVASFVAGKNEVSTNEVLKALDIPAADQDQTKAKRVAGILRRLNWKPPTTSTKRAGLAVRLWTREGA